jgi:hypothetical protein
MNKENLNRYAELKAQIKALEAEVDDLKPGILAEMKASEADKVDHDAGTFTVSRRKSWTFTPKVESIRESLKTAEADEKADGSATFEETEFLLFKEKTVEV